MPRKNRQLTIRKKSTSNNPELVKAKTRYPSRAAANQAITDIKRYQLDLKLSTYQSPIDGGWYLTSSKAS